MAASEETPTIHPDRLRLLYELACAFAERLELDELITLVVEKCQVSFDAEGASVLLHDQDSGELYFPFVVSQDPEVANRLASLRFPADQGVAGHVLKSGEVVRIDVGASDERLFRGADEQTGTTTRTMLCAPLATHDGNRGVLQVVNHRSGGNFPADDENFLIALAGSVAVAVENARLYGELRAEEERLKTEVGSLRHEMSRRDSFSEIVGTSPRMNEVFQLMESAAATPITVLIEGETGTGKELVAKGIHDASNRAGGPFVAVNCAALPENLLESELFGHRRGSFTGASHDRVGLLESAKRGTIFLDEVGEMPQPMQAKMLRVLQEGEIVPIGDNRPRKIDVRVISATNRTLSQEVQEDNFREDLYYRLSTFPIQLPALRERREDIGPIAARMVQTVARRYEKKIPGIGADALTVLEAYGWPGNVRELHNEIERACALTPNGEQIRPAQLSPRLSAGGEATPTPSAAAGQADGAGATGLTNLREARAAFEADFIRRALSEADSNVTRAAREMGLSRVALQKKMKDYGLR